MRWAQLCGSLNILWHCLSLWLEWKLTFSSPVQFSSVQFHRSVMSNSLRPHEKLHTQRIFQFVVIHTVKGFSIVNEAEEDVLLEFSCFFHDPADIGNLISGSSAFSKSSLNIWKFSVHLLLKPRLENFQYYFASVWNKCTFAVVWTFFGIAFL